MKNSLIKKLWTMLVAGTILALLSTSVFAIQTEVADPENPGPSAPANFTLTVDEDLHVVLAWEDPTDQQLEKIQVFRSVGEGVDPTEVVAVIISAPSGGTAETYTDTDVAEGDVVNYQLRPVNINSDFGYVTEIHTVTVTVGADEMVTDEETGEVLEGGEEEVVEEEVVCEEDDTECVEAMEEAAAEEAVEEMIEASGFSDIADHWAVAEIGALAAEGILTGNPDGTFGPDEDLDRAEAAAVLYRVLGFDEPTVPEENPFPDVDAGAWYAGYVSNMKAMEMIHGYGDGTYGPANVISRAEFTKLALEVYYYVVDDEEIRLEIDELMEGETTTMFNDLQESWYTPYVTTAGEMGFTSGYACGLGRCFGAANEITRAEAAVILNNVFIEVLTAEEVVEEDVVEEEVVEEEVVEEEVV